MTHTLTAMRSSVPFTDAHLSCLRSMIRMKPTPDALRLRSREAWSPWQQIHLSHLATHTITFLNTSAEMHLCICQTCILLNTYTPASNIKPISRPSISCFTCSPTSSMTRTDRNRRDTAQRCLAGCYVHHHGEWMFTPLPASGCCTMVTKTSVLKKTLFQCKMMNVNLMKVCIPVLIQRVDGKIRKRFFFPVCVRVCVSVSFQTLCLQLQQHCIEAPTMKAVQNAPRSIHQPMLKDQVLPQNQSGCSMDVREPSLQAHKAWRGMEGGIQGGREEGRCLNDKKVASKEGTADALIFLPP